MSRLCGWMLLLLCGAGAARAQGWEERFEGKTLDPRWTWRVPIAGPTLSLQEKPGWLRVRIPEREEGFNHWNEPQPVDHAPQLRAAAPAGNWALETRIHLERLDRANQFQVGLVVGAGDDHLLTFGPLQAPGLDGFPKAPEAWLEITGVSGLLRAPGDARDLRLRLIRAGSVCRAALSRDGQEWLPVGTCLLPWAPRFVGIIGKTFSPGPPVVFDVEGIRLTTHPEATGRRALIGVGGEYPTGYRGMVARLGLPHEVLLDHQLADGQLLRRNDLLLIGGFSGGLDEQAREALMRYVREGGTALLDSRAFPPARVVAGQSGPARDVPEILVGAGSPLAPLLGQNPRFAAGESRFLFTPANLAGAQVLARFAGRPGAPPRGDEAAGPPAIWAMPLGRGLLVYSSPALGATLSWGPTHDALAAALLRCLGEGRVEPQLVPEGARFGRKQLASAEPEVESAGGNPPALERRRLSTAAESLPREARAVEEEPAREFNLSGVYHPARGRSSLLLNYWNRRFLVGLSFEPARARLARVENGKTVASAEVPLGGTAPIPFLVKERRDSLVLLIGGRRATLRAEGLWEGKVAAAGAALDDLRCQPVEPAFFSDDFTRAESEASPWEVAAGNWSVRAVGDPKMGANPFTYLAEAQGAGLAVAGFPFWDDYAFEVSVRPTAGGAVGQAFYFQDERNYLLFRARVLDAPRPEKDGLELVRVADGKESVLGRRDGCLVKGQWYRLAVQVRDGVVSAAVDGERVAAAEEKVFPGGRVALTVRDAHAQFDDVEVRGLQIAGGSDQSAIRNLQSQILDGGVPRFAGTLDRDTWAGTALQWRADPGAPGLFWRHGRFHGDFSLAFRCRFDGAAGAPGVTAAGQHAAMALLLAPETGGPEGGCRLTLRPVGKSLSSEVPAQCAFALELARPGAPATRCTMTAGEHPLLELRREGDRLLALVDGRQALACPAAAPPAHWSRLGFLATGFRPRLSGLALRAGKVLDYCFDRAPTDWWVASGTWELASRWPCTPEWSWFAGESRQVAAIWHKRPFTEDVLLDLHVGPRTVDHGEGRGPHEICRAFNAVICGDGQDVRSGYTFVVGADKAGTGATLSRGGREVARSTAFRFLSDAHNQWLNVRAEKQGVAIRLWVGDQRVLSWEDPDPLPGGRVGIWTEDNAVMIPRATIYHQ